jgi:proline iminopeptidase
VPAAYAARMDDPDGGVRARAAADWVAWEDSVISLESQGRPGAYSARVTNGREAMVRICSPYFASSAWLEEGIPGLLLHECAELGGPVHVAHELAKAWPGSQLTIVEDAGHTGSASMRARRDEALLPLSRR